MFNLKSKSRLAKNSVFAFSSSILERGFSFIAYALIARLISGDSYGILLLVISTVNVFTTILSSGTSMIITRQVAISKDTEDYKSRVIFNSAILLTCIIGIICIISFFCFTDFIAIYVFNDVNAVLIKQIKIIAPILLLQSLTSIILAYLQGFELFKVFTISNFFKGISLLVFVVLFGMFLDVDGVSIAFTASSAFNLGFLIYLIMKAKLWMPNEFSFSEIKANKKESLNQLYLAFPLILLSVVQIVGDWMAQIILSNGTHDWGAVAEFGVARQYAFILPMASAAITQGVLPILAKENKNDSNEVSGFIKISLLIQIILAAVGLFFAPFVIPIIFGKSLVEAVVFAKVLIVSYTIFGVFGMIGPLLLAKGKTNGLLIIQSFRTGAILICVYFLINQYGKIGIVYGYLLAESITALWITCFFYNKIWLLVVKLKVVLMTISPLVVMIVLMLLYNSLFLNIVFAIVFISTVCFLFKLLSPNKSL